MLEFILEFSYMKIDMSGTAFSRQFSQITCRQDPELHNFLGDSLTNEKFQAFVAAASILSVRFPKFFRSKILTGITLFYKFYLAQLQKRYSPSEIAKAFLDSFDEPDDVELCSPTTIPAHFLNPYCRYDDEVYFNVPIKYALHLIASRKVIPSQGRVLVSFSDLSELIMGVWEHALVMIWERRDFNIIFPLEDAKKHGYPQEGLFFHHPVVDFTFRANFTHIVLLPAIKKLYIQYQHTHGSFQITPLHTTGDFMTAYLPQLPACFANPIKRCFAEKDHLRYEQGRFDIFNFLFGIGVPYEVVEDMWKKMVLQSKYGGELHWKQDSQPLLKNIHKTHTNYWKDKQFFIGGCKHIMTETKIVCPHRTSTTIQDIEDIERAMSKCKLSCGQKEKTNYWNPIVACKTNGNNKRPT